MAILTAIEAIRSTSVQNSFPEAHVEPFIDIVEETFRRKWIGEAFYDLMEADKIAYTTSKWSNITTYSINDYVDYFGKILRSRVNQNKTNPNIDGGTNWEEVSKFSDPLYNTLWEKYLKSYLSNLVISKAIQAVTNPVGAKGAMKYISDESSAIGLSKGELQATVKFYLETADDIFENMQSWINSSYSDYEKGISSASGFGLLSGMNSISGDTEARQISRPYKRFNFRRRYANFEDSRQDNF